MTIRKQYLDLTDGQLHYRMRPGNGRPVVFLHQTASSSAMWEKVMALLPEGPGLFAFDTPGFGGSFDPAQPAVMADYARWIGAAIAALGLGQVDLVGHHTGAAIALAMVAANPGMATSLVMIGPDYVPAPERQAMMARLTKPFYPVRSGAYLLKTWEYLRIGGADADIALLHREMMDTMRAYVGRPQAYRAVWETDFVSAFDALACPALIMAARDDLMFPGFERARTARPDIAAITLTGGANFEPDLVPGEIAAHLQAFWSQLSAR